LISAGLTACTLLVLACTARAEVHVTDVLGRSVTLAKPAERVMLGFYFEDFIAITGPRATDRLRAVSLFYWKGYRPLQYAAYIKALPGIADAIDVGDVDNGTLSAERIVAAAPDVAILSAGQYQYLGASAGTIEAAGIPIVVVDYNAQTVEKHVASTMVIGEVMGTPERARRLADQYRTMVADTERRVAAVAAGAKPKVYVELGQKGPSEYGNSYGKGMWAGVVDLAGGVNIAAGQIGAYGPLQPEYILTARPDAIFVTGSEWTTMPGAVLMGFGIDPATTQARLGPFLDRAGWSELPAVKGDRVYAIYHGGVRTLYDYAYLRFMAKALYPAAFADVDPLAELQRYYADNLPVKLDGTFMVRLDPGRR
jgi:ABC-type Fe3+-hydroxamate transport system substrate-binding protein